MLKNDLDPREDSVRYVRAIAVLTELRSRYRGKKITGAQYRAIREMALNGDRDGALRAIAMAIRANEEGRD